MKNLLSSLFLFAASAPLSAQDFHADMTTEVETNFKDKANWLNLLKLSFSVALCKEHLYLDLATFSLWETRKSGVSNDYQTFSNIFTGNMLLTPATIGLRWENGKSSLFLGVQKSDDSYIAYPGAGLFTNSSAGTYPTMSMNSSIPVYPSAALGIHYVYSSCGWTAQASVLNGKAGSHFTGSDNVFRFCPKSDGIFSIATVDYSAHGSFYMLGSSFYSGHVHPDLPVDSETPDDGSRLNRLAFHGYAEQQVSPSTKLVFQASASPSHGADCTAYFAVGATKTVKKTELGVISNYAHFSFGKEWATEATAKITLFDNMYIQPTLDFIRSDGDTNVIGLFRAGYSL